MFGISRLLSLLGLVPIVSAQTNTTSPIVDIGYTKYRGVYNSTLHTNTYYGIYYAVPPIGIFRWSPPLPIKLAFNDPDGIVDATKPGPTCIQGIPYWRDPNPGKPTGREDCLLLNVIQPANMTPNTTLPVLVMIHGGGYTVGDSLNLIRGDALVKHSQNSFIYVSIQYRLGAYGFLYSDEIKREGGANAGLLDQRLALEWVQRYINYFGGDPSRVTLMGGSAGGGSVTSQMIMYGGQGGEKLFRGAIIECPWWQQYLRKEQLEKQYRNLLNTTGCPDLSCLRQVEEDKLAIATQETFVRGYREEDYGYGNFYYGPCVDGEIISDLPSREFKKGNFVKVPVLVDRNGYEGTSFTNQSIAARAEEISDLKVQYPYADENFFKKLDELYPAFDFNSTFWRRQTWFGDAMINCPTYYIATSLSTFKQKVWKLIFNAGSQTHGATNPFLFNPEYGTRPGDNATLAHIMKDWFVNFAIDLDPNNWTWSEVKKPYWPLYEKKVMSVNYTEMGIEDDAWFDRSARCEFLWENGAVVQN
ncbi:alpha/beta-hydrolase [Zopfia rhizophila CBS 207.26]|uniref:Carboxylic ester hydrolase n=1 Tax=Zopfia rhizophila CBS 207.26 TaxID=1314779 RepID=A0A6A6DH01_9PEZI|nr:alpha/beta-hydrolase [Zopfia rhizophila CBS 207.26]